MIFSVLAYILVVGIGCIFFECTKTGQKIADKIYNKIIK